MSIDIGSLTVNDIRAIQALFGASAPIATPKPVHPWVGRYVLCRCYSAGVHAGVVQSIEDDIVTLTQSRRLWSWTAAAGVALSGVAVHGLAKGKVDTEAPEIRLTGVIEVIPMSPAAEASVRTFKVGP